MATYSDIKQQREEAERNLASLKVAEEQAKKETIRKLTVGEVQGLADAGAMSKEDVARLFGIDASTVTEDAAPAAAPKKKGMKAWIGRNFVPRRVK